MSRVIEKQIVPLLIIVQLVLTCLVFNKIVFHPGEYIFQNRYDGLKNYFTLLGYVKQEPSSVLLKFEEMNYPYGDYIFYTDNTPLIAVPLRFVQNHFINIENEAIYLFNLIILLFIPLTSLFLFRSFNILGVQRNLSFFFSLCLPWLNPQILRLPVGHFNLSISLPLVIVIYLALKIFSSPASNRKSVTYFFLLFLTLFFSSFLHIYYLLIGLVFLLPFFAIWLLWSTIRNRKSYFLPLTGIATCLLSFLSVFLSIRMMDTYYQFRKKSAEGYDWIEWKLQLESLFTPYYFNPVKFVVPWFKNYPYESYAYLGTGALLMVVLLLLFIFIRYMSVRVFFSEIKKSPFGLFFLFFLTSALLGLIISLGDHVSVFNGVLSFTNLANPFYYLRKVISQIDHFRCIGRFSWAFFWAANIALIFVMSVVMKSRIPKAAIVLVMIAYTWDTATAMLHLKREAYLNPFYPNELQAVKNDLADMEVKKFQAMLVLPFYHVGSEDYNFTIDPEEHYCAKTMQFSIFSGLPLINSKMSRTPLTHTYQVFSIFSDTISNDFLEALNDKPILTGVNKTFYSNGLFIPGNYPLTERHPAREVVENGYQLLQKYDMRLIKEGNEYDWYELRIKPQKLKEVN